MSRIFDALQRSEAERAGADRPPAPVEAAEVLERAERYAAEKWSKGSPETESESEPEPGVDGEVDYPNAFQELASEELRLGRAMPQQARPGLLEARTPARSTGKFETVRPSIELKDRLVSLSDQFALEYPAAAEAYRLLGVRLRDLRRTRPMKKILLTSTTLQEGKSTVSANLALTQARSGARVLVVEGDLRRPGLSHIFGLAERLGISDCLAERAPLNSCIVRIEEPELWIMPAGRSLDDPLALLQSHGLGSMLDQLEDSFETIVIDSPPVLPLADTSIWMRLADGILLVARQGRTEKGHLKRGIEALDRSKLIGALLNCSKTAARHNYYYQSSHPTA